MVGKFWNGDMTGAQGHMGMTNNLPDAASADSASHVK